MATAKQQHPQSQKDLMMLINQQVFAQPSTSTMPSQMSSLM
jgi:hypothetical protein